jgi:serine/threonine protein kinase
MFFSPQEEGNDASIKLADFGFAKRTTKEKTLKTLCGTPNYMAPEIFDLNTKFYDYRCDMWSVGVVVYALVGGYLPFEGSLKELAAMVTGGEYYFHDEYWTDITREAKHMITGLLQVNPDKRLSAQDAMACKWMGLDDEELSVVDLSTTQQKMRSMTGGKEKLKNAVKAVRMAPTSIDSAGIRYADATFSLFLVLQIIGANKMASMAGFKAAFSDVSIGVMDMCQCRKQIWS